MRMNTTVLILSLLFVVSGCASLPENKQNVSYYLTDTSTTQLGLGVERQRAESGAGASSSGMLLIENGVDALIARAALARAAEKTLDVQYYLFHSDVTGRLMINELWNAAERGVRVRLLIDDMDLAGKDKNLAYLNAHPNINIRIFNPFIRGKSRTLQFLTRFNQSSRRMHNKSFNADNAVAILGGRNIGDEYFGAGEDVAYGDLDVALCGAVINEISEAFDLYWNSELAYPIHILSDYTPTEEGVASIGNRLDQFVEQQSGSAYEQVLTHSPIIERAKRGEISWFWGNAFILVDDPLKLTESRSKTQYHLAPKLAPVIDSVQYELIVVSPYFVPGKPGVAFFKSLIDRGVKVRILSNSLASNDVPVVHAGYSKYRKDLLKSGVELYEMDSTLLKSLDIPDAHIIRAETSSLHAKYFVMDRKTAFIGSLNLDPRSFVENTEIGAVISSQPMATKLAENFDSYIDDIAFKVELEDGRLVWISTQNDKIKTWHQEPNTGWWKRFKNGFFKLLPGESLL